MGESIGLRELRQYASQVVRRVEDGETLTVTVSGRPAARLVPVAADRTWRSWSDVSGILTGAGSPDLAQDLRQFDDEPADPFERFEE